MKRTLIIALAIFTSYTFSLDTNDVVCRYPQVYMQKTAIVYVDQERVLLKGYLDLNIARGLPMVPAALFDYWRERNTGIVRLWDVTHSLVNPLGLESPPRFTFEEDFPSFGLQFPPYYSIPITPLAPSPYAAPVPRNSSWFSLLFS
jgi:hypothetical protein